MFCAGPQVVGISSVEIQLHETASNVTGKRGNVEINNSPQAGIEPEASRFKIQHSTE